MNGFTGKQPLRCECNLEAILRKSVPASACSEVLLALWERSVLTIFTPWWLFRHTDIVEAMQGLGRLLQKHRRKDMDMAGKDICSHWEFTALIFLGKSIDKCREVCQYAWFMFNKVRQEKVQHTQRNTSVPEMLGKALICKVTQVLKTERLVFVLSQS